MRSLILILSLALTNIAAAQPYRLERVVVEGSRVPESIVRAETRLIEERSYSDDDFRQAVDRVRRLPFVVDATYRVEPGLTAGTTTLIIRILDEGRVFYDAEAEVSALENADTVHEVQATVGGRLFLDDLGVLEPAVHLFDDDDGGSAGLTYRLYGIAGTSAFAFVSVEQRFGVEGLRFDPLPSVTLGMPLTPRQTLTFFATRAKSRHVLEDEDEDDDEDPPTERFDDRILALRWTYDTTDDPLFATRGTFLTIGPTYRRDRVTLEDEETKFRDYTLDAEGVRYWRLPRRNVVGVRFAAQAGRVSALEDDEVVHTDHGFVEGAVLAAHDFHAHTDNVLRPFRARIEAGLAYRQSMTRREGLADERDDQYFATAGFTLRHRWGTLRLTGVYDWN